ncbi:hypothetical protein [Halovivax asiaticus]|nr:hypothetical protein [Halovivax asiaticus]
MRDSFGMGATWGAHDMPMADDRRGVADGREKRKKWISRFHETHPLRSFIFFDLVVWLAAIGIVRLLPFVSVRWWSAGSVLAITVSTWVVLVFERPQRPGFDRR